MKVESMLSMNFKEMQSQDLMTFQDIGIFCVYPTFHNTDMVLLDLGQRWKIHLNYRNVYNQENMLVKCLPCGTKLVRGPTQHYEKYILVNDTHTLMSLTRSFFADLCHGLNSYGYRRTQAKDVTYQLILLQR